jgi:rhamnogalacturonan endolyase
MLRLLNFYVCCLLFGIATLVASANDPGGGTNGVGANVTLTVSGGNVILANGIISATIATNNAQVSSYLFNGVQMLDTAGKIYYSMDGGTSYENPGNCVYTVTKNTTDMVDISCKTIWADHTNRVHAFDIDCHFVLRRGDTGLYAYAILAHPAGYPDTGVGEWRIVWKLPHTSTDWTFERIYVDALRNWYWGTYSDFVNEASTGIGEIKTITTGARAGQMDCKYEYAAEYQKIGCWGHASDTNKIGVWFVLGGYDYLNDGPNMTDLTVAESYLLQHFGRDHFGGSGTSVAAGETWSKIYGPFLLYCNKTATSSHPSDALWADAQAQVQAEIAAWPYAWLTNSDYPADNLRGVVTGKIILTDPLKPALAAGTNTWVGVSQPDPGGNWQFESKRYQTWVHPDASGNFSLAHLRPGMFTLSAWTPGALGEFTLTNVIVTAGATNALGNLNWTNTHPGGQIAWEIGIPDRSAAEFKHGTNYWYPYLWTTYTNDFPNPLTYNVGTSNWTNDWNYAQPGYLTGTNTWSQWKWRINFTLTNLPTSGSATMSFGIASIYYGAVDVYVNDESAMTGELAVTIAGGSPGGNALIREGIHAKYGTGQMSVPLSSLRVGTNTITLIQRSVNSGFAHVMYDYMNLELPASVVLPAGRPLVWRGGNGGNAWDINNTANFRDTNNAVVVFTNGDNVTFADIGATNPAVNFAQQLWPGSVSVITSSNYTFSGSGAITGAVQLIKAGSGTLTVNTTNSLLTGTVSLSGGKITLGNVGASIGTGTLELNGGTFTIVSGATLNNPIYVLAPSTIGNSGNSTIGGTISGGSILTAAPPNGNVLTLGASAANFTGIITLGNGSGNLRINQSGTWGVPNGTMNAGTNAAYVYTRATGGGTAYFGAFTGGPRTTLTSSDQSSNPGSIVTYVIGALNQDSTFAGTNTDVGKAQLLALTKVGSGTLTLSGDSNYRGVTRVSAGTLQVAGSITTTNFVIVSNTATLDLPGTITASLVQINSGGTLTGCGAINGNLLNNGALLADCGGTLEISGNVTNNGTMQFLNGSGLAVTGVFVNNGLFDLLTGLQTLPPNFVNNGTVLLATNIVVTAFTKTGGTLSLAIYGYDGHTYQLQRSAPLSPPNWQNIGPTQDGAGAVLTFTDTPGDNQNFYRMAVSP